MHENFFHKLKVYYEDTDSGGVVYYANYLKYLERARTEALFSIGFSNKKIQEQLGTFRTSVTPSHNATEASRHAATFMGSQDDWRGSIGSQVVMPDVSSRELSCKHR